MPVSTQILSFDNFSALETYLRALKAKHNDMIKKYEETLGSILRDTRPSTTAAANNPKTLKNKEKWIQEMEQALSATVKDKSKATKVVAAAKKEDKSSAGSSSGRLLFGGGKGKEKQQDPSLGEWILVDPMSIFVGPKNRGLAEIYFETINVLRESVGKINLALSICNALKAKAASAGNASLVVSFVNDIPTKVVLKPNDDNSASKKYTMAFNFTVPSALPPSMQ